MKKITVIKKFKSKKGQAALCSFNGIICVRKTYISLDCMRKELQLYELLKNSRILTAKVLQVYNENTLLISYIEGYTALDNFLLWETVNDFNKCKFLAVEIAKWLTSFYSEIYAITGKTVVLNDIHLGNFIINNSRIIGIDFEDWNYGEIEKDIAILCTYVNSYFPMGTEFKKIFCFYLLEVINKSFIISEEKIRLFNKEAAEELKKRRLSKINN